MIGRLWLFVLLFIEIVSTMKTPPTKGQRFLQRRKRKGEWKVAWQCPYYKVYSEIIEEPGQVCEEWRNSFTKFKAWMLDKNHIDRVLCTREVINDLGNSALQYEANKETTQKKM